MSQSSLRLVDSEASDQLGAARWLAESAPDPLSLGGEGVSDPDVERAIKRFGSQVLRSAVRRSVAEGLLHRVEIGRQIFYTRQRRDLDQALLDAEAFRIEVRLDAAREKVVLYRVAAVVSAIGLFLLIRQIGYFGLL